MAQFTLKSITTHPSPSNSTPRPPEFATVKVEVAVDGIPTLEWDIHVSPLTSLDGALIEAQAVLAKIASDLTEAAKSPLLPLPRKKGMFDDADEFIVRK